MEAMSVNTNLGNNRLDQFSHGGNYGVTNPTSGMDVFTVDSVGRDPTPRPIVPRALSTENQPPPPYSSLQQPSLVPPPPWSIVNNPNSTQAATVANGSAVNGKAKIYDPNEDTDSLSNHD